MIVFSLRFQAVGVVRKISEDLYKNLDDGKAVLQVASMSTPLGELRGNVSGKIGVLYKMKKGCCT